jgi:hypothetical protein
MSRANSEPRVHDHDCDETGAEIREEVYFIKPAEWDSLRPAIDSSWAVSRRNDGWGIATRLIWREYPPPIVLKLVPPSVN